jgi:hypothetical protein
MLGSSPPGGFTLGGTTASTATLPRIDLPTLVIIDPRIISATLDPTLAAAVLDPLTTAVTLDN